MRPLVHLELNFMQSEKGENSLFPTCNYLIFPFVEDTVFLQCEFWSSS